MGVMVLAQSMAFELNRHSHPEVCSAIMGLLSWWRRCVVPALMQYLMPCWRKRVWTV